MRPRSGLLAAPMYTLARPGIAAAARSLASPGPSGYALGAFPFARSLTRQTARKALSQRGCGKIGLMALRSLAS